MFVSVCFVGVWSSLTCSLRISNQKAHDEVTHENGAEQITKRNLNSIFV